MRTILGAVLVLFAGTGRAADGPGWPLWRHDLVKDFEAKPVEFGFAASPLVAGGLFVVHVGGAQAAAIAFNPADGAVVWKTQPAAAGPPRLWSGTPDRHARSRKSGH